jgi:hypothetical protein
VGVFPHDEPMNDERRRTRGKGRRTFASLKNDPDYRMPEEASRTPKEFIRRKQNIRKAERRPEGYFKDAYRNYPKERLELEAAFAKAKVRPER